MLYRSGLYDTWRSGTRSRLIEKPNPLRLNRGLVRLISDQTLSSTTPFGLILGPDLPSVDEPRGGTLGFSRHWIRNTLLIMIQIPNPTQ